MNEQYLKAIIIVLIAFIVAGIMAWHKPIPNELPKMYENPEALTGVGYLVKPVPQPTPEPTIDPSSNDDIIDYKPDGKGEKIITKIDDTTYKLTWNYYKIDYEGGSYDEEQFRYNLRSPVNYVIEKDGSEEVIALEDLELSSGEGTGFFSIQPLNSLKMALIGQGHEGSDAYSEYLLDLQRGELKPTYELYYGRGHAGCYTIGINKNFENYYLYTCTEEDGKEALYAYNVVDQKEIAIEGLKTEETFTCNNGQLSMEYELTSSGIDLEVCSRDPNSYGIEKVRTLNINLRDIE